MQKRNIALAAVLGGGIVIALVAGLRPSGEGGPGPTSTSAPATGRDRGEAPAEVANRPPPAAPRPVARPADIPGLEARDRRRREAMAPFSASILGALDTCITPGPGPRVPQRLVLQFKRATATPAGFETFELADITPVDVHPGQPGLAGSPMATCLSGLVGRTLAIPEGPGSQESSFQEIIAIPIPASVAWAPPPIPVR